MAYILDRRLKDLVEDAGWEKALKDVVEVTAKEKVMVDTTAEKKAATAEKAKVAVQKKHSELQAKLGETEFKLAEATSVNTAWAEELVDLRIALEACENKWYNEGLADAKNFAKPVIRDAQKLAFEEGWLAALKVLGVLEDSPLRDPD